LLATNSYGSFLLWLALGVASAPIWGAILWTLWQGAVRPRLIPRAEVERLAAELLARYGDRAEEVAFAKEYGAWRDSDVYEQGKWRRVRSIIERYRAVGSMA
jgi:hypothetical protein